MEKCFDNLMQCRREKGEPIEILLRWTYTVPDHARLRHIAPYYAKLRQYKTKAALSIHACCSFFSAAFMLEHCGLSHFTSIFMLYYIYKIVVHLKRKAFARVVKAPRVWNFISGLKILSQHCLICWRKQFYIKGSWSHSKPYSKNIKVVPIFMFSMVTLIIDRGEVALRINTDA